MIIAPALVVIGYAFMGCLLVRAVFSWIEPYPRNRIHRIAYDVTEPVLAPVRRLLPPLAGFDLSFVLVFLAVSLLVQMIQQVGG